jgi:hypothetical protein
MIEIRIDRVDGSLCAGQIIEPVEREPDLLYDMDEDEVAVWIEADDPDPDEIDSLIWVTLMTTAWKWKR